MFPKRRRHSARLMRPGRRVRPAAELHLSCTGTPNAGIDGERPRLQWLGHQALTCECVSLACETRVLKTGVGSNPDRGFESHPLRH